MGFKKKFLLEVICFSHLDFERNKTEQLRNYKETSDLVNDLTEKLYTYTRIRNDQHGSKQTPSNLFDSIKGVFGTLLNICDGAFLGNIQLFLDVRLGSKYTSEYE